MSLFVIACSLIILAALLAERISEKGMLIVPVGVWYALLAGLGLWLLTLTE